MIFVAVTLLFGAALALPHEGRIVGGSNARLGEFPYMVSIQGSQHTCGGAIISDKYILTAAHCIHKYDDKPFLFGIFYGAIDLRDFRAKRIGVKKIYKHPDYQQDRMLSNDIAIMQVDGNIKFDANVQPIALAPANTPITGNVNAILTGWGLNATGGTVQTILQKVIIRLFTNSYCKEKEKSNYNETMHCCAGVIGGGKGQCSGDSGGPLTVNGVVYGVVSWSVKPCMIPMHPGVFARVSTYRSWISNVTGI